MTTQKTHYELYCNAGLGFQKLRDFASIGEARAYAENHQSREELDYKIVSVTVTCFDIPTFTVPAYAPSVEEIADDIIGYSDGSFDIGWSEDYEKLSYEDRTAVETLVHNAISNCDCCGWHFRTEDMETYVDSGELLCYRCAEDRENELEEDEEEDED
jgi:hypothetical protein